MTSETEHELESRSPGGEDDDQILSMKFGGKTIGENLEAANAAGRVIRRADGKLTLGSVSACRWSTRQAVSSANRPSRLKKPNGPI